MIEVFEPGSKVEVRGQEATVITVSISHNGRIVYEVGYWKDSYQQVWLPEWEVTGTTAKTKIGFKRAKE